MKSNTSNCNGLTTEEIVVQTLDTSFFFWVFYMGGQQGTQSSKDQSDGREEVESLRSIQTKYMLRV